MQIPDNLPRRMRALTPCSQLDRQQSLGPPRACVNNTRFDEAVRSAPNCLGARMLHAAVLMACVFKRGSHQCRPS
jgi:hypothetical protein